MTTTKVRRKRKRTPYVKHWCFTINNPQNNDINWNPKIMSYLIVGREVGRLHTPHLQCYVAYKNKYRLTQPKKDFPRAHIEDCQGTPEENWNYCMKDGDFDEYGVRPQTGAQVTKQLWKETYDLAKLGRFNEIKPGFCIRYYHNLKSIFRDNPIEVEDLLHKDNYWIVAPSGYGKSTYARERWGPKARIYDKTPNKWWTGYRGQPNILCDDFGPGQCQFLAWYMKRWMDHFAFGIENKGGGVYAIRPHRFIITSQYTIEECFAEDPLIADAIKNRCTVIELERYQVRNLRSAELALDRTNTTETFSSSSDDEREDPPIDLTGDDQFNEPYAKERIIYTPRKVKKIREQFAKMNPELEAKRLETFGEQNGYTLPPM